LVVAFTLVCGAAWGAGPGSDLRPEFRRASCGAVFPIDALTSPTGAHREGHPSARALREVIRDPRGIEPIPKRRWRLLQRRDGRALYGSGDKRRVVAVLLERTRAQSWSYSSSGDCRPEVVRDGLGPSGWELNPEGSPPEATDTSIELLVTEQACASGEPSQDRILEPTVRYGRKAITITYFVEPLKGGQFCPSNPPSEVTLALAESLGDRALLDGATVVPRQRFPDR